MPEYEDMYKDYEIVINVSDECYIAMAAKIQLLGKQHYWFPMGESGPDMGRNSIYGALYVMYQAYIRSNTVLLHCHAGANRSPVVQACFHFMMTGEHIKEERKNGLIYNGNMLYHNAGKHLPTMEGLEKWLTKCKFAFDNPDSFIGGMFDWTMDDTREI